LGDALGDATGDALRHTMMSKHNITRYWKTWYLFKF
jgi:hypothetical protein